MKQAVLREMLRVDANHHIHINVPADIGDEIEVIVLPVRPQTGGKELGGEERFMRAAYSAVIPDNPEEDAIWEKYSRI